MRAIAIAVTVAALTLAPSTNASAQFSIDFTGEAPGAIHGRTIQGVTFGFFQNGTPSNDAAVASGPGCLTFVCDPSLEGGTAGNATLVMSFGAAISSFQFGAVGSTGSPTQLFVELFDQSLSSIGIFSLAMNPLILFSEGLYVYTGSTAISRASLTFDGTQYERFAIDNVQGNPASVTPEPVSMALLGTGLAGIVAARRRRKIGTTG
jgi:hypothetical protein